MDLIGRPFSQATRDHFLPLLTSTHWWSQTQLALRKVFQLDPDFQERMFARQIAVMKGQAWNVVETLKTADHGPLELTRRAKVCVWDDLVDVPVAVPMRATSSELRRRESDRRSSSIDEVDIGAAAAAASSSPRPDRGHGQGDADHGDLLDSPADMPHPGRFEISMSPRSERAMSPEEMSMNGSAILGGAAAADARKSLERPRPKPPTISGSYHGPSRALNAYAPARQQRRFSFATAATRRNSNSIAQQMYRDLQEYDDDLEGDLGYAAAEGMEGSQRKVIVERLEPVKTKNPVFTWC